MANDDESDQELANAVEQAIAPMVKCPRCGQMVNKQPGKRLAGCFVSEDPDSGKLVVHHRFLWSWRGILRTNKNDK